MRKTTTITYPASPQHVSAMLSDPGYQAARIERLGLQDATADVTPRGQGFVSTISGTVPLNRVPEAARRFVRSAVTFCLSESWGGPARDGSRTGNFEVSVKGVPVSGGASTRMTPSGESTTVTVDLDLKVGIPLVGRKIEEKALSMTQRLVTDEQRRASAWLAAG